jgi:hypothetical protein
MVLDPETMSRSVIFAVSLAALLVAHQVGDHVIQTDRQAADKADPRRVGWPTAARAMAGHLVGYHVCSLTILLGTAVVPRLRLPVGGVVLAVGFSAVTHALLDLRWPVRALLRATGAPRFAEATTPAVGLYCADQALHRVALLISAGLLAGMS